MNVVRSRQLLFRPPILSASVLFTSWASHTFVSHFVVIMYPFERHFPHTNSLLRVHILKKRINVIIEYRVCEARTLVTAGWSCQPACSPFSPCELCTRSARLGQPADRESARCEKKHAIVGPQFHAHDPPLICVGRVREKRGTLRGELLSSFSLETYSQTHTRTQRNGERDNLRKLYLRLTQRLAGSSRAALSVYLSVYFLATLILTLSDDCCSLLNCVSTSASNQFFAPVAQSNLSDHYLSERFLSPHTTCSALVLRNRLSTVCPNG